MYCRAACGAFVRWARAREQKNYNKHGSLSPPVYRRTREAARQCSNTQQQTPYGLMLGACWCLYVEARRAAGSRPSERNNARARLTQVVEKNDEFSPFYAMNEDPPPSFNSASRYGLEGYKIDILLQVGVIRCAGLFVKSL